MIVPAIEMPSPTKRLLAIPTPPDTTNAPVVVDVAEVVALIVVIPDAFTVVNTLCPPVLIPGTPVADETLVKFAPEP